jgi:hypothetical protein
MDKPQETEPSPPQSPRKYTLWTIKDLCDITTAENAAGLAADIGLFLKRVAILKQDDPSFSLESFTWIDDGKHDVFWSVRTPNNGTRFELNDIKFEGPHDVLFEWKEHNDPPPATPEENRAKDAQSPVVIRIVPSKDPAVQQENK